MQNTPLALDRQFVSSSNTPTRVSFRVQCILQKGDIGYCTWRVCIPVSKGTRTLFVIAWLLPTKTWAYQPKIGNFTSDIRLKHGGGSVGYTLSSIVYQWYAWCFNLYISIMINHFPWNRMNESMSDLPSFFVFFGLWGTDPVSIVIFIPFSHSMDWFKGKSSPEANPISDFPMKYGALSVKFPISGDADFWPMMVHQMGIFPLLTHPLGSIGSHSSVFRGRSFRWFVAPLEWWPSWERQAAAKARRCRRWFWHRRASGDGSSKGNINIEIYK